MQPKLSFVACALLAGLAMAGPGSYTVVNSYPYPQLNAGSSTGLDVHPMFGLAFLTQQAGNEDVYFLYPYTGVLIRQFTPAGAATIGGLAMSSTELFAGQVTNGADFIRVYDTATGNFLRTYAAPGGAGSRREGLAFKAPNSLLVSTISRFFEVDAMTGAAILTWTMPAGVSAHGLAYDGRSVITCSPLNTTISFLDPLTGAVRGSIPVPGAINGCHGLAYDGCYLYVANQVDNRIYVMAPTPTGVRVGDVMNITLEAFGQAGSTYFAGIALTSTPGVPLPDGRTIPLNIGDPLFFLCLTGVIPCANFSGVLDANGQAFPTVGLPAGFPSGVSFYCAFITLGPGGIACVSAAGLITT